MRETKHTVKFVYISVYISMMLRGLFSARKCRLHALAFGCRGLHYAFALEAP